MSDKQAPSTARSQRAAPHRPIWAVVAPILAAALLVGCGQDRVGRQTGGALGGQPAILAKVSLGIQVSPAMCLAMVAKDRGCFRAEGLDVELKQFTAGKFALQAFLAQGVDFAIAGDVPVCLAAAQGNSLRVVAQVVGGTRDEVRIVAIRDGPATDPRQWFRRSRRRLATSFGGGPEFFTYSFMQRYGIAKSEVEILSQKPEDMPAALESGSVDAISIFDPFAFIAERRLGVRAVTFADSTIYSELYVIVARPDQTERQAGLIAAMLRGLVKAGDLVRAQPAVGKAIVRQYTKLDPAVIDGIWNNFDFRVALTPQLPAYWERELRWARESGAVQPSVPTVDLRRIIDARPLRVVAAGAVGL